MLARTSVSARPPGEPGRDQRQLYAAGLEALRDLAGRTWTDHNHHDPGITLLECLCYALTDLTYRAGLPIVDLLASRTGAAASLRKQFPSARELLPGAPLTLPDYRRLLIDLEHVRNAWLEPAPVTLWADPATGSLLPPGAGGADRWPLVVRGLYRVKLDLEDGLAPAARDGVLAAARDALSRNRNLCEDFLEIDTIGEQKFVLCAALEITPEADVARVHADVLHRVGRHLAPAIGRYRLSEMLQRTNPEGTRYTADTVFTGPKLERGFIDEAELADAELRTEVRLSDVIHVLMGIEGVQAVRDASIHPADLHQPPADKWRVPVAPGMRPALDVEGSRQSLVSYRRNLPVQPSAEATAKALEALSRQAGAAAPGADATGDDLEVPPGRYRDPGRYGSFQEHLPAIYGVGAAGLKGVQTEERHALALQLRAYLSFFDQVMADFCQQLANLEELFSIDPGQKCTWFHFDLRSSQTGEQATKDWAAVYPAGDPVPALVKTDGEGDAATGGSDRRNRFLDHLIARYGERFHDHVAALAHLGMAREDRVQRKCEFLASYPAMSRRRGLAAGPGDGATGVLDPGSGRSGLEWRVALLLGIPADPEADEAARERLLVIEDIRLRLPGFAEPLLPACLDPGCRECGEEDPYSYRLQVILPGEAGRFADAAFRRFAEEVIRQETPAHILPRICWVAGEVFAAIDAAWSAWLEAAGGDLGEQRARLGELQEALAGARNVYHGSEKLHPCKPGDESPKFVIGQNRLGKVPKPEPPP